MLLGSYTVMPWFKGKEAFLCFDNDYLIALIKSLSKYLETCTLNKF